MIADTRMRRIVIAGNGIAGLTAADTLRANGFDGDTTIIGDEAHAAYSRPALSKALLRDHDDDSSHLLPPAEHGAHERLGAAVTGVDVDRRVVIVDAHDEVPYDGLVIATGCRARRLVHAQSQHEREHPGCQRHDTIPAPAPANVTRCHIL